MDARLRERRGVLRVSASRHIDCSVRRRPFGSTPFYAALANSFLAASALQMRPPSGWMRCTPQPYPPAAVLLVRSATLVHRARDVPSSLFRPRHIPQRVAVNHSFRNEWRIIVHPTADFASRTFQKPPLIRKCSKSRHSFEASPLSSGDYRRKARPSQAVTFQKPPLIGRCQPNRRSFKHRSRFKVALAFIFQNSSK